MLNFSNGFLSFTLNTHVFSRIILTNQLSDGQEIETPSTATITTTVNETGIYFLNNDYPYYSPGKVITKDIRVVCGVIQIIDSVLRYRPDDVVDIIVNDPNLSVLASLVIEYGLADALKNVNRFTVFAPNDTAFGAISSILPNLIDTEIITTLQYHLLDFEIFSNSIDGKVITSSINGIPLILGPQNGTVFIQAIGMYI